jgi:hypothetical protein
MLLYIFRVFMFFLKIFPNTRNILSRLCTSAKEYTKLQSDMDSKASWQRAIPLAKSIARFSEWTHTH